MKVRLNVLKEYFAFLVTEGRVDDAREKFPDMEDEDFEYLVANQPAGSNNKYLMWACARADELLEDDPDRTALQVVMQAIRLFDGNKQRLEKKDIYQYKTVQEVEEAIDKLEKPTTNKRSDKPQADSEVIYNDERWMVVRPYTTEQACHHGSNTTWCIAARGGSNYFGTYSSSNNLFYMLIDKQGSAFDVRSRTGDKNSKYAIVILNSKDIDGEDTSKVQAWNPADQQVGLGPVMNHVGEKWPLIWSKIKEHVKKNPNTREVEDARKATEEHVKNLLKGEAVSYEGLTKIAKSAKLNGPIVRALIRVMKNYSGPTDHRDPRSNVISSISSRGNEIPGPEALELIKFIETTKPEGDRYWYGRYHIENLIKNAPLTPDAFRSLASGGQEETIRAILRNPNCPEDVLNAIVAKLPELQASELKNDIYRALIRRGTITAEQMRAAMDGGRWNSLAHEVLHYPEMSANLTPELLRLVPIRDASELKKFLGLPNVPPDLAADLITAHWKTLKKTDLYELLRDIRLPTEMLERLWANKDPHMRVAMLQNAGIGVQNAVKFAGSSNSAYRFAVAHNSVLPAENLVTLSRDESPSTRSAVAANNNTPEATLTALAADEANVVRASVASNPKTPRDVLRALAKDSDEFVRKSARKTMKALGTTEAFIGMMMSMKGNVLLLEEMDDDDTPDIMIPHWSEIPRGAMSPSEFVAVYLLQNNGHASREDIEAAYQSWNPQHATTRYYRRRGYGRQAHTVRAKNVWQLIKDEDYSQPQVRAVSASGKGWWWSPAGINKGSTYRLTPAGASAALSVLQTVRADHADRDWTRKDASPVKKTPPSPALTGQRPAPREPGAPRGPKTTYKVYGRLNGAPAHTRLKGQAYGAPANTSFRNGEQAALTKTDDNKLKVKKVDSDHEQTWDPIDG